jgi:hypothetical protein
MDLAVACKYRRFERQGTKKMAPGKEAISMKII